MSGTLVIGCGGSGSKAVSALKSEGMPCLVINWGNDPDIDISEAVPEGSDRLNADTVSVALEASRDRIIGAMEGYSDIILVVSPGGFVSNASMGFISGCARSLGARLVMFLTLPFGFESERREAVLKTLPGYVDLADRLIISDLQYSKELIGVQVGMAVDLVDALTRVSIRILSNILGSIPFFSTFESKTYSFSRGYSDDILKSYNEASANPRFSPDLVGSKTVICTDAPMDDASAEALVSYVTNETGKVPELIQGKGEGKGVTVFVPISLRTE